MTKNKKFLLLVASTLPVAHAATIITLTGDAANSSAPAFGSAIASTVNDGFAYDPLAPASATPDLLFSAASTYHANEPLGADVTLTYNTGHVVAPLETTLVFDVWGRAGNIAFQDRDDNFNVELFDGTTSLGIVSGLAIADAPSIQFARATFTLAAGANVDRIVITGFDTEASSAGNNFTVQEVRFAAIPEPSTALLSFLSVTSLLFRRRR